MVERTVSVTVVGVGPLAAIVIAPLISEKAVNVTGEPLSPARAPVAVCAPAFVPRVRVAAATPFASVGVVVGAMEPPPATGAQVTSTFAIGVPLWSRTITRKGLGSVALGLATWLSPVAVAALASEVGVGPGPLPPPLPPPQAAASASVIKPIERESDMVPSGKGVECRGT